MLLYKDKFKLSLISLCGLGEQCLLQAGKKLQHPLEHLVEETRILTRMMGKHDGFWILSRHGQGNYWLSKLILKWVVDVICGPTMSETALMYRHTNG